MPLPSRQVGQFPGRVVFRFSLSHRYFRWVFARKYCTVTVLGKLLDPLVDKLLVSLTMIMLIPLNRIPIWMVIAIIAREIALTGLRGIAAGEGIVIQASALGKYKTILQSVAIGGLCLHYVYLGINFHVVGMVF